MISIAFNQIYFASTTISRIKFRLLNFQLLKRCHHFSMDKKIIIVGAGPSGVAAATRLVSKGFKNVTILEAENRIGGRVNTVPFGANVVDLGAQWFVFFLSFVCLRALFSSLTLFCCFIKRFSLRFE